MVVPNGNVFPAFRNTVCCERQTKAGESVLVFSVKPIGSKLVQNHILHRRCLLNLLNEMPLDRSDQRSEFEKIRERILATGDPFPD